MDKLGKREKVLEERYLKYISSLMERLSERDISSLKLENLA